MSTGNYKISIITANYNSGPTLETAIQSVLAQGYKNYEHIIVDGLSTDCSLDIIKSYDHLVYVSEKDNGQADAMNKGFKMSTGDIVVYLNADDYFFDGAFDAVIPEFINGEDFVVGNVLIKSERLGVEFVNTPRITFDGMLKHWEPNAFCHNPVGYFYRRKVQEECPFNILNYESMDLEFLLDAAYKYTFKKIEYTLGCFCDSLNTKTHLTQDRFDYWQSQSFPYIDKYLYAMDVEPRIAYETIRRQGYEACQQRMNALARSRKQTSITTEDLVISVIIPSYNCQEYLPRCIDSVLRQTYKNFEIIVVNDCSTDNTLGVFNEKYNGFQKIKIISNKINMGLSATRNAGIDESSGDYLFFLDADDWIDENTFYEMLNVSLETDADVVECGIKKVYQDNSIEDFFSSSAVFTDKYAGLYYYSEYKIATTAWNKLYKRSLLIDNNIRFHNNIIHEDVIFTLELILNSKKYVCFETPFVNYFQRMNGLCHTKPSEKYLYSYVYIHYKIMDILSPYIVDEYSKRCALAVLNAHSTVQFTPKIYQMLEDYSPNEIEKMCTSACENVFGTRGLALSTAMNTFFKKVKKQNSFKDETYIHKYIPTLQQPTISILKRRIKHILSIFKNLFLHKKISS